VVKTYGYNKGPDSPFLGGSQVLKSETWGTLHFFLYLLVARVGARKLVMDVMTTSSRWL
jgi:hypothetical protein